MNHGSLNDGNEGKSGGPHQAFNPVSISGTGNAHAHGVQMNGDFGHSIGSAPHGHNPGSLPGVGVIHHNPKGLHSGPWKG